MLVDLTGLPVLPKQSTENALTAHPKHLGGHTGLRRTPALARAGVAAFALCCSILADTEARVDCLRLLDNEAVIDKLPDVPACERATWSGLRRASPEDHGENGLARCPLSRAAKLLKATLRQSSREKGDGYTSRILLTGVGVGDFADLVGVEPNLAPTAFEY
ncbi:MAG: hypothetical protein BJ554DRAFT_1048 [Olpidium bornovanus]|uniref:Uncharacterized protein n=1 Tax=Olpidium bornovanus TaxID=278681 RepID=A0A8H7ZSQ9_9FUNG|nr:MAG: hypothetical protein BJ554DRAFT_1048 [Olpidium bornovanus]